MVHSGFEATAVADRSADLAGGPAVALFGVRTGGPMR
jgi:hypothetical protein